MAIFDISGESPIAKAPESLHMSAFMLSALTKQPEKDAPLYGALFSIQFKEVKGYSLPVAVDMQLVRDLIKSLEILIGIHNKQQAGGVDASRN